MAKSTSDDKSSPKHIEVLWSPRKDRPVRVDIRVHKPASTKVDGVVETAHRWVPRKRIPTQQEESQRLYLEEDQ